MNEIEGLRNDLGEALVRENNLIAENERLRTALQCAKTYVDAQMPNESTANILAIIDGVLTSPDYVP